MMAWVFEGYLLIGLAVWGWVADLTAGDSKEEEESFPYEFWHVIISLWPWMIWIAYKENMLSNKKE